MMDRRTFINTTVGMIGALHMLRWQTHCISGEDSQSPKLLCGVVRFKERFRMGWPGTDYDTDAYQKQYSQALLNTANQLKMQVTIHHTPISDEASAKAFIERMKKEKPDGVVLINLTRYLWKLIESICDVGIPTIVFSPIGTSFAPQALGCANKQGVVVLSTLEQKAFLRPLTAIRTGWQIRNSRMLVIRGSKRYEEKLTKWGTTLLYEPWESYPKELEKTQPDSNARRIAEAYRQATAKMIEPSYADLIEAARVYIACERMLNEAKANAITMDCLPHVPGRKTPPPCVAWSRFLDSGIPAGCEADIFATLTLMLSQFFLGRPGFMGNPVAETENNWLIVAHCTAPTRLVGSNEKRFRFILRSHGESGRGVAVQTLFPEKKQVTILRFLREDQLLLGSGRIVANVPHPPAGGCRTMIAIALDEPKDIHMLRDFHHPVVVVGGFIQDIKMFCHLYGVTVTPLQKS